jgi:hypothetical protein
MDILHIDKQIKQSHNIPVEVQGERRYSSSFTTSALDRGEWSASRPGRSLPTGKGPPVPIVQETGWAPDTDIRGKISCLCRGSILDLLVVQSIAKHYTDWATPSPKVPVWNSVANISSGIVYRPFRALDSCNLVTYLRERTLCNIVPCYCRTLRRVSASFHMVLWDLQVPSYYAEYSTNVILPSSAYGTVTSCISKFDSRDSASSLVGFVLITMVFDDNIWTAGSVAKLSVHNRPLPSLW